MARRLSPVASGMVRFDDEDDADKVGGHLTDDSSADEYQQKWSDEEKQPEASIPIKRKR